jgi:Flp pilus assembly protein TadD
MNIRTARVLMIMAVCLIGLDGCSSTGKLGDPSTAQSGNPAADASAPQDSGGFKLSDLWTTKGDAAAAPESSAAGAAEPKMNNLWTPKNADGSKWGIDSSDAPTGSVNVQPAEAGPGAAVAPLERPGQLGDDPHDDLQLAKKYFRSNNFGLAEKAYRTAVETHPRDAEAWVGLAACYDRLRRFDLADRAYQEAIRIIGPTVEILNNQGFSYMLRGDYVRARKKLQEAEAKDPANPYVAANLRLLEQSYRAGKAIQ